MPYERSFCLPQVLRRCLVDRLAGTLTLTVAGETSPQCTVHVRDGDVVFVTSMVRQPSPGETPEAYLVERVTSLVRLDGATVGFDPGATHFAHPSPVPIPRLIVEALRAEPDSARVAAWLGGLDQELDVVADPFTVLRGCAFEPAEGFFVSRIQGRIVPRVLIDEAAVDPAAALRIVCALRFAGGLEGAGDRKWIGDEELVGSRSAANAAAPGPSGLDMSEVSRVFYLVEEKMRAIESGVDHYELLEVERQAPADRIKTSYRELLKTFHPDRHSQLAAFAGDIKQRLERIVAALTNAYSVLSNPKERDAYDHKLADRKQGASAAPPARPAPPPGPSPPKPPPAPDRAAQKPPTPRPPVPKPIVPPLPKAPKPPPVEAAPPPAPPAPPPVVSQRPVAPDPPRQPRPEPKLDAELLFEHGVAYSDLGDFERAVSAFSRCVEAAPDDARMHAALGSALADAHGLDKNAERSLRRAVELDPNSSELYVALADVYKRFDRVDEARRLYKRALLIDPANESARNALEPDSPPSGEGFFSRLFKRS